MHTILSSFPRQTVQLWSGYYNCRLFEPFYQTTYVTQTAGALWISQITCTLSSMYSCMDVFQDGNAPFRRSGAQIAYGVTKAVAYKYVWRLGLLLIHPLTDLFQDKSLLVIH